MSCIVAILEHHEGELRKVSGEVCSEAVRFARFAGANVVAVAAGSGAQTAARAVGRFGVAEAIALEGGALLSYSGEHYAAVLAAAIRSRDPSLILGGATGFGRDILPRLGAHLGVSLAADCVGVRAEGGKIEVRRPIFAGKAILTTTFVARPALVSLRPNVFAIEAQPVATKVETVAVADSAARAATLLGRKEEESSDRVDLAEAEIVVSGGRGLKNPETFKRLLEPLAQALGAAVGASRAVVDAGWRPHAEQVGQTGRTVAPKLYIACGISGAIQHLAGMRTARTIVAINKDPEAPIFKIADYGIVGDCEEILPVLTEAVRKLLGR